MTKPIHDLLPLPMHPKAVPIMDFLHETLHEIVCFGTHILSWNLSQGKNKTELGTEIDMVVPLLFRHLLELIDAISIQVKSGSIVPCQIHLRAFIEAYLSLSYILEKDRYRRSAAFLIVDYYRKLTFYKKLVTNTIENTELQKDLAQYGFVVKKVRHMPEAENAYQNIKSLIEKPMYDEVRAEYLRLNQKRKDIKFYNLFSNISSVLWLSKNLGYYDFYEFFYKEWSNPTHGTNLHTGVLVLGDDGMGAITQIRDMEHAQKITSHVTTLAILLFDMMARKVVPEQKFAHAAWQVQFKANFRNKLDSME